MVTEHRLGMATVYEGDVCESLSRIDAGTVNVVVTSPPYWRLRSYLAADDPRKPLELGGDATPDEFVRNLVGVFELVRPLMAEHGVIFVNLADTYVNDGKWGGQTGGKHVKALHGAALPMRAKACSGLKPRDRAGIPERFALAMQAAGFWWRDTILWHKPAPMPMSFNGWRWERCRVKVGRKNVDWKATPKGWDVGEGSHDSGVDSKGNYRKEGEREATVAVYEACPGCKKCEQNDGLVLRRGAFRTTPDYEPIFMFTVSDTYYCDREAVAEPASLATIGRNRYSRVTENHADEQYAAKHDHEFTGETRNPRSTWEISPDNYRGAHYAAFPRELVERCLKMAMSQRGYCAACGMPWCRVVDVSYENPGNRTTNGPKSLAGRAEDPGYGQRLERTAETLGWRASCGCGGEPVSGVVLDPFGGTGTTAEVALGMGHQAILCELNPEYIQQIRQRLGKAMPLFA